MSDLIDRQAAIDIVVFECGKWTGLAKEISKQLKQLPYAQPDVPDKNVGDMIRRQDAIDAVCMDGCGLCKEAIEQIGGGNDRYTDCVRTWPVRRCRLRDHADRALYGTKEG